MKKKHTLYFFSSQKFCFLIYFSIVLLFQSYYSQQKNYFLKNQNQKTEFNLENSNNNLSNLNDLGKLKKLLGIIDSNKPQVTENTNSKNSKLYENLLNFNFIGNKNLKDLNSVNIANYEADFDKSNSMSFLGKKSLKSNIKKIDDDTQNQLDLLKGSIKTLIEQMKTINDNLSLLNSVNYEIKNVEVDMPAKGKESQFKHGLDINKIFNIVVSIINGSDNNKILKSQLNLISNKILFNWYVDKDTLYLIHPNNLNVNDSLFVEGSKVRISFIINKE